MFLKRLTLHNFMPYYGDHEIEFPTDEQRNVMLVFGHNMNGKTSLLNALRWTLYGVALGRNSREIERINILNWIAADEGNWTVWTRLEFEHEGKEYDLRREMKLRSGLPRAESNDDFVVTPSLREDGHMISGEEIDDRLARIAPEQVSRFLLFDGELLQEYELLIRMDPGKAKQREEIKSKIEDVLGVPALINGRDDLGVLKAQANKVVAREARKVKELEAHTERVQHEEAQIAALQKDIDDLQSSKENKENEVEELQDHLSRGEEALRQKDTLDELENQRREHKQRAEAAAERRRDALSGAWRDLLRPRANVRQRALLEDRDKLQEEFEATMRKRIRVEELRRLIARGATCTTCGEELSEAKREGFAEELGGLEVELEQARDRGADRNALLEELRVLSRIAGNGRSSREIIKAEAEMATSTVAVQSIVPKIEEIEKKIADYDTVELKRKRARAKSLSAAIGADERALDDRYEELKEHERKLEETMNFINANPDGPHARASRRAATYAALQAVFEGGVDALRNRLRAGVGEQASAAFQQLFRRAKTSLEINENYGLDLLSPQGRKVPERSAGAEELVALALIDGLNVTARKTEPIVMDTPLGRLDPIHRANVMKYLPHMSRQVVLLVHEGEIARDRVLDEVKQRIGLVWDIEEVSDHHSRLKRSTLEDTE